MIFSSLMIEQLEGLLKKIDNSNNINDVKQCMVKMNEVIDSPEVCQVIDFIDEQI